MILKDQNIMVILCGSLVSMMEAQTLNYSNPLYGRRTGQIRLRQIPFRHYHEFFPEKDRKSLIETYSVTDGVPKYIGLFRDSTDLYEAIRRNVISKESFLYDEPNFLLRREVPVTEENPETKSSPWKKSVGISLTDMSDMFTRTSAEKKCGE